MLKFLLKNSGRISTISPTCNSSFIIAMPTIDSDDLNAARKNWCRPCPVLSRFPPFAIYRQGTAADFYLASLLGSFPPAHSNYRVSAVLSLRPCDLHEILLILVSWTPWITSNPIYEATPLKTYSEVLANWRLESFHISDKFLSLASVKRDSPLSISLFRAVGTQKSKK